MVADYDAVAADLDAFLRVGYALDAFEEKGAAAADFFPCLDEPGDFLPAPCSAVPDVVDPGRAGFLRVFDRVDPHRLQPFLENGIAEAEICADTSVKGIVPYRNVVMSPAQLPSICSEHADIKTALKGTGEEGDGQLVIMGHV